MLSNKPLLNLHTHEKNEELEDGPEPPYMLDLQISLVPGVVFDKAPFGKTFGDVLRQPYPLVYRNETVYATFVSQREKMKLSVFYFEQILEMIRTVSRFRDIHATI